MKLYQIPTSPEDNEPANHGKTWTEENRTNLIFLLKLGAPIDSICKSLGRTRKSVLSKLLSFRLIAYNLEGDSYYIINQEVQEVEATQATEEPATLTTESEPTMLSIEIKTFVNGKDGADLSDMQIFAKMESIQASIARLESITPKPRKLLELIQTQKQDMQALCDYVDNRSTPKVS